MDTRQILIIISKENTTDQLKGSEVKWVNPKSTTGNCPYLVCI